MLDGICIMILLLAQVLRGLASVVPSTKAVEGTGLFSKLSRAPLGPENTLLVLNTANFVKVSRRDAPAHLDEDHRQRFVFPVSLFQMRFWALWDCSYTCTHGD